MAEISVEYNTAGTKKMCDLDRGKFAIIAEGQYKGSLVWRTYGGDGFTMLMLHLIGKRLTTDTFGRDCPVMVRVLEEGDEVKLKF